MKKASKRANGEGTIYFDEKQKTWRAEIQWVDSAGVTHRKSWKDKKQASIKTKMKEFKKQLLLNNGNFDPNEVTFKEFAEYWVHNIFKPTVKQTSYARKVDTLNNQVYPYLEGIQINKITHSDIQIMVNELSNKGLSYSTVKKAYEAVGGCLRYYRVKNRIAFNPCEGIVMPENIKRAESDIKYFVEDERKKICERATEVYPTGTPIYRLGSAFVLLMYTGMRVGELCALTWDDIDFEERTITVCKTAVEETVIDAGGKKHRPIIIQESTKTKNGIRVIPMTQRAYDALLDIKKVTGNEKYLMTSTNHNHIRPSRLDTTFNRLLNAAGLKGKNESYGVHTLRHTFASMLFDKGCDVKVVSELLGHANTKITENTYIHILNKHKIKAIKTLDTFVD